MKKILIDFLIALAVTGFGILICVGFQSITKPTVDTHQGTQLETVDEISHTSNNGENEIFEEWVVKKFDFERPNLSLLEHNTGEGREACNLLIEMSTDNAISYNVAVECIWRKEISKKGLYWATESTLKKYMNSADEDDAKIFLVFGLGGSPDSPKSLHIVPIKFVHQRTLSTADLSNFECTSTHGIFEYEVPAHRLVLR